MSTATMTKTKAPPKSRLMTAEEFVRDYSSCDSPRAELIDGHVVELPMPGFNHGKTMFRMGTALGNWCDQNDAGHVVGGDTFFVTRRNPDRVRGMDVAFISYSRWPKENPVVDGPVPVPPELAIEVRSPTDRAGEIKEKTDEYLEAGINVVVNLDPKNAIATVHRKKRKPIELTIDDELDLSDVLPGFKVPLAKCFG